MPLNTRTTYEVAVFREDDRRARERQLPDRVVSDMSRELRRGKVLIDWSQNSDFKTTVAVYAMRAKHGGPFISMPVTWDELSRAVKREVTRTSSLRRQLRSSGSSAWAISSSRS